MDLRFPAQGNPKADACFPCPDSAMKELLNHSHREANKHHLRHRHQNARECSKKSVQQGRSRFDARSVRCVRERERREERHVCEPEGRQNGENAAGGFFQHSQKNPVDGNVIS